MAARAPLVLPPSLERLPPPAAEGEQQQVSGELAGIADPDRVKAANKAELERQQAEYCKVHYEQAKARGEGDAENAKGPLGPCRPSILTSLPKWLKGDQQGDDQ